MELTLSPRKKAQSLGAKKYFSGRACIHGHLADRWTLTGMCVVCLRGYSIPRTKAWRENHPNIRAYRRAEGRRYYKRHPEGFKRRSKVYRERHPKKVAARLRRWRRKNVKRIRAYESRYKKRWRRKHPEAAKLKSRLARSRRRALENNAEGTYSARDIAALQVRQKGKCNGCQADISQDYHVDHIIPLSRGGSNWPSNLQLLCETCNVRKSDRTMQEWYPRAAVLRRGLILSEGN